MGNPKTCESPIIGDSACPPELLLHFVRVLYYLLWNNSPGGDATAANGGITCRSPKGA